MQWNKDQTFFVTANGRKFESRAWGPPPSRAPTLLLLHEGLGSCQLWRSLPEDLARATGFGVFAWSRAGYGASDPARLPRPMDFLEQEAKDDLPAVLDAIGLRAGMLVGHSDGGSIAAAYLGQRHDPRIRAAVLIAAHFFTEPGGMAAIHAAHKAYREHLRHRLSRHHKDVDATFLGWADAWRDPDFAVGQIEALLPDIRVPVLAMQGRQDQYGTLAQIEALKRHLPNPPDIAILDECGHSPHVEKPEETARLIAGFAKKHLTPSSW